MPVSLAIRRLPLVAIVVLAACGGSSAGPVVDADTDEVTSADVMVDVAVADVAPDLGKCPGGDLPRRALVAPAAGPVGLPFAGVAGDFALLTYAGKLTFSEVYSGCEAWVIFFHVPGVNDGLFASSPELLVREGAPDTHYLFISDAETQEARAALMDSVATNVDGRLKVWVAGPERRSERRARFHFGLDRASEVEGSLGAHFRDYMAATRDPQYVVDLGERGRAGLLSPSVVVIGPDQIFDAGGSLSPNVQAAPELGMATFLGPFLKWRALADYRRETSAGKSMSLFAETTASRLVTARILPEALSAGDGARLEVGVGCRALNPLACSEWDRIASVRLCLDGLDCADTLEVARWITPYWRRGQQRYSFELNDFVTVIRGAHAADGQGAVVQIELGPSWERATEWDLAVDLVVEARPDAPPRGLARLFGGNTFDGTYARTTSFQLPEDAKQVELLVLLSGHGQTEGDNCAEWCDHRHRFTINGQAGPMVLHEGPAIGSPRGCALAEGVIPLQ